MFINIRDDEAEHTATMKACQDPQTLINSPHVEAAVAAAVVASAVVSRALDQFSNLAESASGGELEGAGPAVETLSGALLDVLEGIITVLPF